MARLWDNTLYIESHYPAFSPRPKCPECFDLGVPVAHLEVVQSSAVVVVPPHVVAPSAAPSVVVVAAQLPWSPTPLVFARPVAVDRLPLSPALADIRPLVALLELCLAGLSRRLRRRLLFITNIYHRSSLGRFLSASFPFISLKPDLVIQLIIVQLCHQPMGCYHLFIYQG